MEYQLVVFELGTERFGVDISAVESIMKMQSITRIPHAPSFVEGITNLRGSVLPIIDLRKRFGIDQTETSNNTRIVIVAFGGIKVGMIVDGVSEVLTITDDVIEPPPPMVSTVDTSFITGIAKVDTRLIILLDLGKVLSMDEVALLQPGA